MEADALDNVFPPETFDYVVFRDSLHEIREHTGVSGVSTTLRNAYSYLRPGGRIIIRDAISHKPTKIKVELERHIRDMFSRYWRTASMKPTTARLQKVSYWTLLT